MSVVVIVNKARNCFVRVRYTRMFVQLSNQIIFTFHGKVFETITQIKGIALAYRQAWG